MSARELLSPKQVALAIGVSESSLKRWCDQGALPTVRTLGGHRRVPLSAVLKFLQETGQPLVHPEILGLPAMAGQSEWTLARAADRLQEALLATNEDVCRRILFDLYLAGHHLAVICDDVIRPSFEKIGLQWDCGHVEVFQERRSCEIIERLLSEIRLKLSPTEPQAPLAMGGTLTSDDYRLPTTMVELVLLEGGWRAESLGTGLPISTLCAAIDMHRPKLFWLSISTLSEESQFLSEYPSLFETAVRHNTAMVLGGQGLTTNLRQQIRYTTYCERMHQLEAFAETWKSARFGLDHDALKSPN